METPPIAEKVKFWEEQDRINQELIPRVLKLHDLFTSHIEAHESASSIIAGLEAKLAESNTSLRMVRLQALGVSSLSLLVALVSIILAVAG